MNNILVHKENKQIPDYYTIKISYLVGCEDKEYKCVAHSYQLNNSCLEIFTFAEEAILIPIASTKEIVFCKDLIDFKNLMERNNVKHT